jgi:hypothetical protein
MLRQILLSRHLLCVMLLIILPLSMFLVSPTWAFTTTTATTPALLTTKTYSTTWRPQHKQQQQQQQKKKYRTTNPLMAWRLIGKYFQIEEMEDRDACTTEVILNPNSTVTTLETNGPIHIHAMGYWKLDKMTGDFIMTLHRTYEAGRDSKISTDVGVFTFTTIRKFIGRLYNIGIKQGISGNIYDVTSDSDHQDIDDTTPVTELRKVGFFEMIDTTLSEDGEVTLRGRTQSM